MVDKTEKKEKKSRLLSGGAIMPIKGVSVNPQLEQFLNQSCNKNGSVKDSESRDIKTQSHSSAESLYKEATPPPPSPCSFEVAYVIKGEIIDNPFTKSPRQFNYGKKVKHTENEKLSGGAIMPIKGVSVNPQLEQFMNRSCNKKGTESKECPARLEY